MESQNTSSPAGRNRVYTLEEKQEILKAAEESGVQAAAEKFKANARTISKPLARWSWHSSDRSDI